MEPAKYFYQELYSESKIDIIMFNLFTIDKSIPKLSEKDKNKTQGNDVISVAIYV